MIWTAFEYIATLIEYVIYADFMIRFLDVKRVERRCSSYFIVVLFNTALTLTFNYYMNFEVLLCAIRILMNFILSLLLLKGTYFDKLFASISTDISALITSYLTLNIFSFSSGISVEEMIESRGLIRLLTLFASKVLLFEATRIILKLKGKKAFIFEKIESVLMIIVFVITLFIGLGVFKSDLNAGIATDSQNSIVIGTGLIAINLIIYILMKRISEKNSEKERMIIDKAQHELYRSQLNEYEKQYNDLRKIRHDMKNHLLCLSALVSENNNSKASAYIDDLVKNKLDFGHTYVDTGNKVVDVIINTKLLQCSKDNIYTKTNIVKFNTYLNDTDMCALFSNVLDNAIEASLKEHKNKEIHIVISRQKGYVNFIIKNWISESVLKKNPDLTTNKTDTQLHGFGIASVTDIVKKYGGMLDFFEKDNFFVADIWLPSKSSNALD